MLESFIIGRSSLFHDAYTTAYSGLILSGRQHLVALPYLAKWRQARREIAEYRDMKSAGTVAQTPPVRPDCVSIYNQYRIRVPRRDELVAHLREKGIDCEIYGPIPLHMNECFGYLGYREGDFPPAEKPAKEVLGLPIYPELSEAAKNYAAASILEYLG